jgi:hypothetical protein
MRLCHTSKARRRTHMVMALEALSHTFIDVPPRHALLPPSLRADAYAASG